MHKLDHKIHAYFFSLFIDEQHCIKIIYSSLSLDIHVHVHTCKLNANGNTAFMNWVGGAGDVEMPSSFKIQSCTHITNS